MGTSVGNRYVPKLSEDNPSIMQEGSSAIEWLSQKKKQPDKQDRDLPDQPPARMEETQASCKAAPSAPSAPPSAPSATSAPSTPTTPLSSSSAAFVTGFGARSSLVITERNLLLRRQESSDGDVTPECLEDEVPSSPIRKSILAKSYTSPVMWQADAGADGTALYLGSNYVVVGYNDGRVIQLNLSGLVQRVQQLPLPVGTLLRDGPFLYAWCPAKYGFEKWKGALFDLTSDTPRLMFELENLGEWLLYADMQDGMLIIGDDRGNLFMINLSGDVIWRKESQDGGSKLLLSDESGVYFGHRKKVCKYDLKSGAMIWEHNIRGRAVLVQNGDQTEEYIYVEVSGKIIQLNKLTGNLTQEFIPIRHRASGIVIGNQMLITGSCPTVLFNLETGEELYRMNFAGRLSDSVMRLHESGRLFMAWDKVYCLDLSPDGIQRAVEGRSIRTMEINLQNEAQRTPADVITPTSQVADKVVLEVKELNGQPEVYPVSEEYDGSWTVRFPVALKITGKRFVVDKLVPNEKYCFYRVLGEILELVTSEGSDINGNEDLQSNNPPEAEVTSEEQTTSE